MTNCHFKMKNVKIISIEEMNEHLAYVNKTRFIKYSERKRGERPLIANIVDKKIRLELTYKLSGYSPVTYVAFKDGSTRLSNLSPVTAYATMNKYEKIVSLQGDKRYGYTPMEQDITEKVKIFWAIPIIGHALYFNKDFNNCRYKNCYAYDINSSFAASLMEPLPDAEHIEFLKEVTPGYVGFNREDAEPKFKGICTWVMPLKVFPGLVKFAKTYYTRKKNAKDEDTRQYAKDMLNYSIGFVARHNPFLHNMIVWYSNERIKNYIDENTLFCNTDSIVSLVPRSELKIGKEIGEFKLERVNEQFAYTDYSYQWNLEIPTYKGISKGWFKNFEIINKRPWDLLIDKIPNEMFNSYYFNYDTIKLERSNLCEKLKD